MEFYNSALIQDEVLVNVAKVIDQGDPAGPTFLNSLGTLVEAIVLHENVYFDPAREAQDRKDGYRGEGGRETVASVIYESEFVQQLVRDGILQLFPGRDELGVHLESIGSDYNYLDFIEDLMWRLDSFSNPGSEEQRRLYVSQAFLMEKFPEIFKTKDLIGDYSPGTEPEFLDDTAFLLAKQGVPVENILQWEGWNHIGCAYADLARNLGLHLYLVDWALPHQLGAIQIGNQKAREIYEIVESRLNNLDSEEVGGTDCQNLEIPPLCQLVLTQSRDSKNAIAGEIFNLRYRHRKFRRYLTSYETEWNKAKTRQDRMDLKNQFENAWKTLTTVEEKPSTRLIYTLWDIFKSPINILEKFGDKLAAKGKEISVIEKARGLHDFWNDLLSSPVANQNRKLLHNLFPNQMDEKIWSAATEFSKSTNVYLNGFKKATN